MASGLRAKLNAIAAVAPKAERKPVRASGVDCISERKPAEAGLYALDADGLRRIGWCGHRLDIGRLLLLDTETTGLSGGAGTVAFLVGVGFLEGSDFVVEQYLMRDYSDEAAMLTRLSARMQSYDAVCTFNGKNFDLPLLQTRFTMCRMRESWRDLEQLDLLYPARRTWKLRLGSCRLSRLETEVLGMPREHDLPGSEVPQRYFDFLKTGDEALLADILAHNRQDIRTLAALLVKLCEMYAQPEAQTRRADLFSMGKALERQGELQSARRLYRVAAIPAPAGSIAALSSVEISAMAAWRLYLLARKNADVEDMRRILEQMVARRQLRDRVYVELAKLYEHRFKNPRRALDYANMAAEFVAPDAREALDRRRERLSRKIGLEEEHR